jgi:sterol desaturase/sphingolipid hydroxylase (fatty acid hydroxylase superfamily)
MLKKTIGCIILLTAMSTTLEYKCGKECSNIDLSLVISLYYILVVKSITMFYSFCYKYKWFNKYKLNKNVETPTQTLRKGNISAIMKMIIDPFANVFMLNLSKVNINDELPSYQHSILIIFLVYFISDFVFYVIHRAMHHKLLYWIHKQHHEFTVVHVFGAEYASVGEVLFSSETFLFVVFYIVYSIHPLLWFSILYFKLFVNVELHSGYQIPFCISGIASAHHCKHHLFPYKGRYSEHPFIDTICGSIY